MREVDVEINDTVDSLYQRFLMPEGIKAMGEAVKLISEGKAPKIVQKKEGESYDPHISAKPELAEIKWDQSALALHNFIRGCDKVPGAWSLINGKVKCKQFNRSSKFYLFCLFLQSILYAELKLILKLASIANFK